MEELTYRVTKRLRVEQENLRPKGPSTRSEWIQSKPEDEYKVVKDMFGNFRAPTEQDLHRFSLNNTLIDRLLAFEFLLEEPRDGSPGTRAHFGGIVENWEGVDIISRNRKTIGTHKPDILHRKQGRAGEQSVRAIGEIKLMERNSELEFSYEQQGEICDFLQTSLMVQPWRNFIYGYMSDGKRFEFYRVSKGTKNEQVVYFIERSGLFLGWEGWEKLQLLVCQDDAILGYCDVNIPGWELKTWLGTGATSAVFTCISQNSSTLAVCKLYLDVTRGRELRKRERKALERLSELPCVPKIVAGAPDRSLCQRAVLIKTPEGLDIPREIRLAVDAFAPIVNALKYAHQQCDVFHNDISPENLFGVKQEDGSYTAMLNDFGSACSQSELDTGVRIGTRRLFYDNGFGARADLVGLVRSIFYLTQATFVYGKVTTAEELDGVMRQQIQFWSTALNFANQMQYEQLYHHLHSG